MTEGTLSELLGLFPESATITNGGVLAVGGCALDELAAEHGTPTLVVDEDALRAQARAYRDGLAQRWPRSRVVFASKAFPCTAVQRVMIEEGLGLDVAGGGEIVTALAAGADPATLVQHGNAKTDEEIAMAVEHGVGLVVVDNTDDLDRLEATVPAGRSQPVLVRVIPEVEAETHAAILTGHAGSKFGLSVSDARAAIARIEASPTLDMRGIHAHVGSQILEVEPFAAAVASVARLGAFDVYDLGGGLGVRYTYADHPPTLDHYLDAITDAARAHLPNDSELVLEPGRSMVATSGLTLYRVITVKASGSVFVAVDGGMGDNLEVSIYGQRYEATVVARVGGGELVTLAGRHCESGDVLIDGVRLQTPKVGDLVAVAGTGAYCYTLSNNYNGARRIPVVFVRDGQSCVVVRRESWSDLLARDVPASHTET